MTAEKEILQKSSRDLDRTRADLMAWLGRKLPAGSAPEVTELTAPPTGQSSEPCSSPPPGTMAACDRPGG